MQTKPMSKSQADPRIKKSTNLVSLTSLRFLAALAIFFFHISLFNSPLPPFGPINVFGDPSIAGWFEWIFRQMGYLGVSFFFVLSGFVLTWSVNEGHIHLLEFWKRRAMKIYPIHIVTWGLALSLFAAPYTSLPVAIANLFLVHGFSTDPSIYVSVNPPSWSLVNDMFFYVLFPFLILPIRKIRGNGLWASAALLVVVMGLLQMINQFIVTDQPKSPITPISAMQFWFGYISPITRLPEFVLGMVLARLVHLGLWPKLSVRFITILLVFCYIASKFVPFFYSFNVMMIIPVGLLIATVADNELSNGASRFLASPIMQKLGEISFGFYICQGITIFYIRTLFSAQTYGTVEALLMILGMFNVTLLGGWALYSFIERPVMLLSRRIDFRPKIAAGKY